LFSRLNEPCIFDIENQLRVNVNIIKDMYERVSTKVESLNGVEDFNVRVGVY